jgi:hypothetical protein
MESIFKNYYYNFKMLFYSSTLSSDKSRNSKLFFRKDFVIQKVIVSEFNFGRHGRTVQYPGIIFLHIEIESYFKVKLINFHQRTQSRLQISLQFFQLRNGLCQFN